jgi:hypothetical protein
LAHEEWKAACIKEHGWYAHHVFPDDGPGDMGLEPGLPREFFNTHTHGFTEKFGVPDVQIVLPLKFALAQGVLHAMARRYSEGEPIAGGVPVCRVLANFPVILVPARDGNRPVHRIVIPDPQGRFWDDPKCEPIYKAQVNAHTGFPKPANEGRVVQ